MNRQPIVLLRGGIMAVLVLSLCGGVAPAQQSPGVPKTAKNQPTAVSSAALDRMIAEGKSPRELAQYLFDTHGCKECHTSGGEGKLGFTVKGQERAQGFEGCIASLKAMSIIAKVQVPPISGLLLDYGPTGSWQPSNWVARKNLDYTS